MAKVVLLGKSYTDTTFMHLMLNAIDMKEKDLDVKIVIEEAATKYIKELYEESKPLSTLYREIKEMNLIDAVCKGCAAMTKTLESAQAQGLPVNGEMKGHPSLAKYIENGYVIIVY